MWGMENFKVSERDYNPPPFGGPPEPWDTKPVDTGKAKADDYAKRYEHRRDIARSVAVTAIPIMGATVSVGAGIQAATSTAGAMAAVGAGTLPTALVAGAAAIGAFLVPAAVTAAFTLVAYWTLGGRMSAIG